jgi:hypothetical protein
MSIQFGRLQASEALCIRLHRVKLLKRNRLSDAVTAGSRLAALSRGLRSSERASSRDAAVDTIGVLLNSAIVGVDRFRSDLEVAASRLGVTLKIITADSEAGIDAAFDTLARARVDALRVGSRPFFDIMSPYGGACSENCAAHRLRVAHGHRRWRLIELRAKHTRRVPPDGQLYRACPERRQASGLASHAGHHLRFCHQPVTGKRHGHHSADQSSRQCRSGHRVAARTLRHARTSSGLGQPQALWPHSDAGRSASVCCRTLDDCLVTPQLRACARPKSFNGLGPSAAEIFDNKCCGRILL